MLGSICNRKGMSMVEVLIAIFMTAVGVMSMLSLQPSGWKTMARADYLGRASGILYKTLENYETTILNPCNPVTLGAQQEESIPVSGGDSAIAGDMTYTVNATIAAGDNPWACVVTVTVTWPTNATGISESVNVRRQEFNRFGCAAPPFVAAIE
jgi:Tfp pilus assembly protein PilV